MISGILFLDPNKKVTLRDIYFKYIPRLIVSLIFYGCMYISIGMLLKEGSIEFNIIINKILNWEFYVHLWYIYMIIGLYIVTPIIRVFIRAASKKEIEYFLILYILINSIIPFIDKFSNNILIDCIIKLIYKFDLNIVSGYIGIYVLGYYLNKYEITIKYRKIIYLGGLISMIFTIVGTKYISILTNKANIVLYNNFYLNITIMAVSIFLIFKYEIRDIIDKYSIINKVSRISKYVFGIYLIHFLPLNIIKNLGITSISFNTLISIPLISIFIFITSLIITYLISKIPIVNKYII